MSEDIVEVDLFTHLDAEGYVNVRLRDVVVMVEASMAAGVRSLAYFHGQIETIAIQAQYAVDDMPDEPRCVLPKRTEEPTPIRVDL